MVIISKAPLRLAFAGGGTDIEPYVSDYGGEVINISIDKFVYTKITKSDSDKLILIADSSNEEQVYSISNLPVDNDSLLLCIYRYMFDKYRDKAYEPLIINTYSDVPFGSGLGGSSSATISIMKGLFLYFDIEVDQYMLAAEAFHVERNIFGLSGGAQDQYASAFGGLNHLKFNANSVLVNSLKVDESVMLSLESKLLLYFTGESRESAKIIKNQIKNQKKRNKSTLDALHMVKKNVFYIKEALLEGNFENFYKIINSGWHHKKRLSSKISSTAINDIHDKVIAEGALCGKISGAGGGGFMWFLAPPERQNDIKLALVEYSGYFIDCKFSYMGAEAWIE